MTLTDLLVPTYRNMLQILKGLLDKAEAQLARQGRGAAVGAAGPRHVPARDPAALRRGPGAGRPAAPARRAHARRSRGHRSTRAETPASTPARWPKRGPASTRRWRIWTRSAADALDRGRSDALMVLDLAMGLTFDLTRAQFARDWALGQFYFHVMAAYAILRRDRLTFDILDYFLDKLAFLTSAQVIRPGYVRGSARDSRVRWHDAPRVINRCQTVIRLPSRLARTTAMRRRCPSRKLNMTSLAL